MYVSPSSYLKLFLRFPLTVVAEKSFVQQLRYLSYNFGNKGTNQIYVYQLPSFQSEAFLSSFLHSESEPHMFCCLFQVQLSIGQKRPTGIIPPYRQSLLGLEVLKISFFFFKDKNIFKDFTWECLLYFLAGLLSFTILVMLSSLFFLFTDNLYCLKNKLGPSRILQLEHNYLPPPLFFIYFSNSSSCMQRALSLLGLILTLRGKTNLNLTLPKISINTRKRRKKIKRGGGGYLCSMSSIRDSHKLHGT